MKDQRDDLVVTAWVLDFWRAFQERPRWAQRIARITMGRYAWREIIGAREALRARGFNPDLDYGLERADYHGEGAE
jgi:hypothetical protein